MTDIEVVSGFVPRGDQAPESDWMKEHKGEYVRTSAYVWYCDDDVCGCHQAQVVETYRNKVTKTTFVFKTIWEGGFYSDHCYRRAENDLIQYRQQLKKADPELEAKISWQDGIEYDRDLSMEDEASVWA